MVDEVVVLKTRETGTSAARAARRVGRIPAVLYGKGIEPMAVVLDPAEAKKILSKPRGHIHHFKVQEIDLEGNAMIQDVEYDPIKGTPVHIDLHKISLTDEVKVEVPIAVHGEEVIEKRGYVLQRQLRGVTVSCLPGDIPEFVELDVSNLNPGDTVTAGELNIPDSAKLLTAPAEVVVVVLTPRATEEKESEEETKEAAAEPQSLDR